MLQKPSAENSICRFLLLLKTLPILQSLFEEKNG